MSEENKNVRRIAAVDKSHLATELAERMIGFEIAEGYIGAKRPAGDMLWYCPVGGDAEYNSMKITSLSGTGDRNIGVDNNGNLKEVPGGGSSDNTLQKGDGSGGFVGTAVEHNSSSDNINLSVDGKMFSLQSPDGMRIGTGLYSGKHHEIGNIYTKAGMQIDETDGVTLPKCEISDISVNKQITTKEYVDDKVDSLTLQTVTTNGNTTNKEIFVNVSGLNNKLGETGLDVGNGSATFGWVASSTFGITYMNNRVATFLGGGGVQINNPYTSMGITDIESATGKILISKEYADDKYSGGGGTCLWEDDSTTLKPITDKDHLLLGGTPINTTAVGKLEINVPSISVNGVEITGADSGWNGQYNEESVSRYKMDDNHWIEDTGWYWIVCSDPDDAWNTAWYYGAGGNTTPASVTDYNPTGSGTAHPSVQNSGTSTVLEAITTNGKVYATGTIKSGRALQVANRMAIGVNTVTDEMVIGTAQSTSGNAIVFEYDNGSHDTNLMRLATKGSMYLDECELADIDAPKAVVTKEYVDQGAYTVKTLSNVTGALVGDRANGDYQRFTLTGDVTLSNPTNMEIGQQITFEFRQGGTGHTVTRGSTELLASKPNTVHLITVVKVTSTTFVFTPATEVVQ